MGWLRQMMAVASPPFKSYDALADAALSSELWPGDYTPQVRSLAAIFSKLDRQLELEWLSERPEVQQTLATLLGQPLPDSLRLTSRGAQSTSSEGTRVAWLDLRVARPLDLLEEELPPGIPEAVLRVGGWDLLWWHAPSGAGRSLVGRWLAARDLARYVRAATWADVRAQLPSKGPVFVEVESAAPCVVAPIRPGVCVAAPFAQSAAQGWRIVRSPVPAAYLDRLIDWIGSRLPRDGHFERRAALEWLSSPLMAPFVRTLGEALGLCGLLDQFGLDALRNKTPGELARAYFENTLGQAAKAGNEDASWVRRLGFQALLALTASVLTNANDGWDAPRSFETWLELVPTEHQRGADLEWMKLSLALAKSPLRTSDLERAAQRVPPGAYRIVRTLQAVGMLRPSSSELWRIEPRWFGTAVLEEAQSALVHCSPFEWGEALLRPGSASAVARSVYARLKSGDFRAIDEVLDLVADDSAAQVAALECVFVQVGLLMLQGLELPTDQLEALWDEQLRLRVELPERLPSRRIEYEGTDEPLLAGGAWLLAALAIAEHVPASRGLRHALLRPWVLSELTSDLARIFDEIAELVLSAREEPWAAAAFALVDRLRSTVGGLAAQTGAPHALELPGIFLDEIAHGVLDIETCRALASDGSALSAVTWLAKARRITWAQIADAVTSAWRASDYAEPAGALLFSTPLSESIWREAPAAFVVEWLPGARPEQRAFVYPFLGDSHWLALTPANLEPSLRAEAPFWQSVPAAMIAGALAALPAISQEIADVLWRRAPDQLLVFLDVELSAEKSGSRADSARGKIGALLSFVERAPADRTGEIVRLLTERVDPAHTPLALLNPLRSWLHRRVAERAAEWGDAYALLAGIERALMPLRPEAG